MTGEARKRIVVDGLYGIQSYGDDAMLLALMEQVSQRIPKNTVTVLSRHPGNLSKQYGIEAIRNLDHPEWVQERGYWFYGFNPGQPRDHIDRIRDTIRTADLLVIGGGNLLLDITDDWLRGPIAWHWFSSEMARIYQVPYMLYANSIGPFKTEWGKVRSGHIVRGAAAVTVRDEESFALAGEMSGDTERARMLPDPALLMTPDRIGAQHILGDLGLSRDGGRVQIALSVRDLSWKLSVPDVQRFLASVRSLADSLISELDATILFIPQCSYEWGSKEEDDRNVAQAIADGVQRKDRCHVLTGQYRADEIMGLYSLVDLAFTTRLHGAVFSAAARTPFIAVDYLPKVRGFLRQLNMESYCIRLDEMEAVSDLVRKMVHMLRDRDRLVVRLDQAVTRAEREARKHFDPIVDLCGL